MKYTVKPTTKFQRDLKRVQKEAMTYHFSMRRHDGLKRLPHSFIFLC